MKITRSGDAPSSAGSEDYFTGVVRIDPLFPTTGLGKKLGEGAGGQYALIATSAFVQEPR